LNRHAWGFEPSHSHRSHTRRSHSKRVSHCRSTHGKNREPNVATPIVSLAQFQWGKSSNSFSLHCAEWISFLSAAQPDSSAGLHSDGRGRRTASLRSHNVFALALVRRTGKTLRREGSTRDRTNHSRGRVCFIHAAGRGTRGTQLLENFLSRRSRAGPRHGSECGAAHNHSDELGEGEPCGSCFRDQQRSLAHGRVARGSGAGNSHAAHLQQPGKNQTDPDPIRTGSGPGSPAGQPGWGGGSDRVASPSGKAPDPFSTGSGPGSPAGQPRWGGDSDRASATEFQPSTATLASGATNAANEVDVDEANDTQLFARSATTTAGAAGIDAATALFSQPIDEEDEVDDGKTLRLDQATQRGLPGSKPTLSAATTQTAQLTRVGAIMGTPLYMSPEQCAAKNLDARSDIYSLGVIAYQMLAGEPPFAGNTASVMKGHIEAAPQPLRERVKKVPKRAARVVMSALAKDPANRPQTAAAFANSLRAEADSIGSLYRRAFALYFEHFPKFLRLSLIAHIPVIISTLLLISLEVTGTYLPKGTGGTASVSTHPAAAANRAAGLIKHHYSLFIWHNRRVVFNWFLTLIDWSVHLDRRRTHSNSEFLVCIPNLRKLATVACLLVKDWSAHDRQAVLTMERRRGCAFVIKPDS